MITNHDIVRLRARATYFGREAARAKSRNCLIYCRALAAHLDCEASELERDIGSNAPARTGDEEHSPNVKSNVFVGEAI
jgi:hypothetical protein